MFAKRVILTLIETKGKNPAIVFLKDPSGLRPSGCNFIGHFFTTFPFMFQRYCLIVFLAVLSLGHIAFAQSGTSNVADSTENIWKYTKESNLSIAGVVLTRELMEHSEGAQNWPFLPLAAPMYNYKETMEKDFGKILSMKGEGGVMVTPYDVELKGEWTFGLIHLLELGVSAGILSAWNYGEYAQFMGKYDPHEKDFDSDIFLTEYAYMTQGRLGLALPLMVFLPKSKWSKIILRLGASLQYYGYTGADDGELWHAGVEVGVNGWRYDHSATFIYMLPFEHLKMVMIKTSVGGYFNDSQFDDIYKAYDPSFKTVRIQPMMIYKMSEKWVATFMMPIARERKFVTEDYVARERFLLEQDGSEWNIKTILLIFTRKF